MTLIVLCSTAILLPFEPDNAQSVAGLEQGTKNSVQIFRPLYASALRAAENQRLNPGGASPNNRKRKTR